MCAAAILLLLALIIWWWIKRRRNAAFQALVASQSEPVSEQEWPRVSVLVVSQEQAVALERALPSILEQDYPNYEVVVVDAASTDATTDAIKRLKARYDHLRVTFVPVNSQIRDIQSFALTLGVRAARTDWVLVTAPGCEPGGDDWVKRMARHISDDVDLIVGTSEGEDALNYCMRKAKFIENDYSLNNFQRVCRTVHEWSPQACIYQRE